MNPNAETPRVMAGAFPCDLTARAGSLSMVTHALAHAQSAGSNAPRPARYRPGGGSEIFARGEQRP